MVSSMTYLTRSATHYWSRSIPNIRHSSTLSEDTHLVDTLLHTTASILDPSKSNLIAYSGGVDSSLVAALVSQVYKSHHSPHGSVRAIIGLSPSLPPSQLQLARSIAHSISIELTEVPTKEYLDPTYMENNGQACYICKTHLYSALTAIANSLSKHTSHTILYNGTNADDRLDTTRIGLQAASNFSVHSPLQHTSKQQVRQAAKHLGLPNWNHAASPCLRSRLALGVQATEGHLQAVNEMEVLVRNVLELEVWRNMRVRVLSQKRVRVEVDRELLDGNVEELLRGNGLGEVCERLGFTGGFQVRVFKSGNMSGANIASRHTIV